MDYTKWQLWVHYGFITVGLWFLYDMLAKYNFVMWKAVALIFIAIIILDVVAHEALKKWTGWDD